MEEWEKTFLVPHYFHELVLELVNRIPSDKYQYVYGIPRGGLVVAVYLSHRLKLPCLTKLLGPVGSTLVVDDIADTGKTLKEYKELGFDTATIYYKPRSIIKPTYFVKEIKDTDWIVYPYEDPKEIPNRELSKEKDETRAKRNI